MTTKDEALKLALETFQSMNHEDSIFAGEYDDEIAALREALTEQPAQQEPVAYIRKDQLQKAAQSPMLCEVTPEPRQDRIGIHTSPPASKPWVGLTDEEIEAEFGFIDELMRHCCYRIEAKLREKNGL